MKKHKYIDRHYLHRKADLRYLDEGGLHSGIFYSYFKDLIEFFNNVSKKALTLP